MAPVNSPAHVIKRIRRPTVYDEKSLRYMSLISTEQDDGEDK